MVGERWIREEPQAMRKWKGDAIFVLVAGALIVGWMYLYPRPGDSPLAPLEPPDALVDADLATYASVEGLKLTYRLYEPNSAPRHVLVFLHDTLLHSGWYANLGRDLAAQGVAVYLPDRRGWGHSAGDRRQVFENRDVLVDDITAMIAAAQARFPQSEVYLGGHGRGAGLVLTYAATRRPLPGIVLVSPFVSDSQRNLRAEGWRDFASAHPGEAFLARSGLVHWPVWRYNWPQSMVQADPMIESRCSIACQQETVPDDPKAAYGSLTVPLLYMQGQADPLLDADRTPAEVARFAADDIKIEILADTGYLSILDVAAAPIANWLETHSTGQSTDDSWHTATATSAATVALLQSRAMFACMLCPPVRSTTRDSR
jgi:alpha-beta hydrolase superfamily lysophospholipase